MARKVHRLKKLRMAEFVDSGPFATEPKLKGKAAEGIRYQSRVDEELSELAGNRKTEQWIRFNDSGQWHYCRPDSILETYDRVIVVEAKLSLRQLDKAKAQLRLYRPLLELIFEKPTIGIVAFKNWIIGSENALPMIDHPEQALFRPLSQLKPALGWNFI